MIVIDTSSLIDSLTGPRNSAAILRGALDSGEIILLPSVVLYEWRRGPRLPIEIRTQETLLPSDRAVDFGRAEAMLSAQLYRSLSRARSREIDIAIAATAILRNATLWTLNKADFSDIPEVQFAFLP